jgi:Zn-dependent peptidase ImmA (M78 family)/DNA-binding XRE family transcriptional regulator
LARKRRGLTKKQLAESVGVSTRAITAYESGELEPGPLTLPRIADALRFPIRFFDGDELDDVPPEAASFRALTKMTAKQRHSALAAGTLALSLHDWISARFRLPEPSIPRLGPGVDPETAAEVVRAEWELGESPISNMIHLLEAHGVRVFSLVEECREVDAFSFYRERTPFVFLNTQKSAEHSRMDAAHELGHLVLHWHHEVPQGRDAEREAQIFASAFLMPRAAILASAPRHATIANLMEPKRKWRVSLSAMVYRLHALGALTDWHYRTLNVELTKRGYRTSEPRGIQRETSQVIAKVFSTLRREGVGKNEISRELDVFPEEIEALVFGLAIVPLEGNGSGGAPKPAARPDLRLVREANG